MSPRTHALAQLLLVAAMANGARAAVATAATADTTAATTRTITVPLDRQNAALGSAKLTAELGAPFDAKKPTLFVVADAQQFYVRAGAMAKLQQDRFGDGFNVVGVIGRGSTPEFVAAAKGTDGKTDWKKAWGIFNSDEWIEDLEAMRRAIVGPQGKILLYGQSGGAFLTHQYVARHGRHVSRVVTPAALHPFLVKELGLNSDRFWEEIGRSDSTLHAEMRRALARHANDRERVVMTLQRQNFFVPPDRLAAERARLIRALAAGDDSAYAKARTEYQVDAVQQFFDSDAGIPIRVRLYEFVVPSGALEHIEGDALRPDLENQRNFAAPLLALHERGEVPAPTWNRAALRALDTEVLVLAGAVDHTVDYRSSIALAYSYPRGTLFLADDDHQLHRMSEAKVLDPLIRAFLAGGAASEDTRRALAAAEPFRWRGE
jgi:pimeloyl-ACP methyl ester carboxylesterase